MQRKVQAWQARRYRSWARPSGFLTELPLMMWADALAQASRTLRVLRSIYLACTGFPVLPICLLAHG